MPIILGINSLLEALESRQPIDKIFILSSRKGSFIPRMYRMAKKQGIPVVRAEKKKIERLANGSKHQGVVALLSPVPTISLDDILHKLQKSKIPANLIVIDKIQDPHNFGAIIRSAEVMGVQAVIYSLRENVSITDTVVKSSSGAIFHIDVCKIENINRGVERLKENGIWIYTSSSHADKPLWEIDFTRPLAVLIGSEGKGVRPSLLKKSDEVFRIPQMGKTESLNASVATGIILTEVFKQRQTILNG